jgi:hypothetical protein
VRPRRHVHRGHLDARAVLIDATLPDAAARLLAFEGEVSAPTEGRWLVRWSTARRIAVDEAPGLPLIADERRGLLLGAPFDDDELDRLAGPRDEIVYVDGDRIVVQSFGRSVDPAGFVDVSVFDVAEVRDLGRAPSAPARAIEPVREPRSALGIGEAPPERTQVLAALGSSPTGVGSGGASAAVGIGVVAALWSMLGRLLSPRRIGVAA